MTITDATIRVELRYHAQLAAAAERPEHTLSLPPGATVLDAARAACDAHGPRFREILCGPGDTPSPWILIALNDRAITRPATGHPWPALAPGDRLAFLSPISGG